VKKLRDEYRLRLEPLAVLTALSVVAQLRADPLITPTPEDAQREVPMAAPADLNGH